MVCPWAGFGSGESGGAFGVAVSVSLKACEHEWGPMNVGESLNLCRVCVCVCDLTLLTLEIFTPVRDCALGVVA